VAQVPELASELRHLQEWLELDSIEVGEHGDLARMLHKSVKDAAAPARRRLKRG
jgi:uncharacterized protein YcaQ